MSRGARFPPLHLNVVRASPKSSLRSVDAYRPEGMTISIEAPQCPICQDPFTTKLRVVAIPRCGHTLCKDCARKHFSTYHQKECPMCRTSATFDDLIDIYLGYGTHNPESLSTQGSSDSRDVVNTSKQIQVVQEDSEGEGGLARDKTYSRGLRIVKHLRELASSEPCQWREPTHSNEDDLGVRLIRTGAFIRDISRNTKGVSKGTMKILGKLGSALSDLQIIFRKVIALAQEHEALQKKLDEYDLLTGAKVAEFEQQITVLNRKISTLTKETREKEMSLRQRLHKTKEDLETEKKARLSSDKELGIKVDELDNARKKAVLYQKKYHSKKQELDELQKSCIIKQRGRYRCKAGASSDSSLVFDKDLSEEDEDDLLLSPSPLSAQDPGPSQTSLPRSSSQPPLLTPCSPPSSFVPRTRNSAYPPPMPTNHRDTSRISNVNAKTGTKSGSSTRILTMPVPPREAHRNNVPKKRQRPNLDEVDII